MASHSNRVLVSGGAGFIGSNIVDELVRESYEVGVLDNLSTGNEGNISKYVSEKKVKFYNCDISNFEDARKIVRDYDTVIHEAALVSVVRSVEDPVVTNNVNVGGTINLLKASVDSSVTKFVYASSSSVFGETSNLPKKEDMDTIPVSPYGVSKLAAENYCKTFAKVYGLNTVSLRYFNVYGPRQRYGPYSGVIPTFIKRVVDGQPPIINGDGEQTRDFTYVQDVVQANILCLKNNVKSGSVFNIARGGAISINELARVIISLLNKDGLEPAHAAERPGDIMASYADITLARKELGFEPVFDIKSGLQKVIDWFLSGNRSDWD